MPEECIFCRIANQEVPVELVYNDDMFAAFRDIHPVAPVHLLIVPKNHIPDLRHIEDDDADLLGRAIKIAAQLAGEAGDRRVGLPPGGQYRPRRRAKRAPPALPPPRGPRHGLAARVIFWTGFLAPPHPQPLSLGEGSLLREKCSPRPRERGWG